jgi:membrane-bound serine protease (ClpP class)
MLIRLLHVFSLLLGLSLLALPAVAQDKKEGAAPRVHVVPVTGVISPATYDLIRREIRAAERAEAALLVLAMDTPGGLYESTQQIVQAILDSPVPVATFVSPSGAHAASAGTYILYGSHLAAMAPSTRLGAATPVHMGQQPGGEDDKQKPASPSSALERKMVSDASAFIRSLAEHHGRNTEWAIAAVVDADSLTASEALAKKVIEVIADSPAQLAEKAHGREVRMKEGVKKTLDTKGAEIVTREPGLRHDLLEIITHPNIALLLMTLGTYGLIDEFANPGTMVPGVIGAIFLLLGLYAMNVLPVNFSGLALLFLGIALMTAEAFTVTFGILGIGGAIAFICGALLLLKSEPGGLMIDPWLIFALAASSFAVLSVSLGMVVKSLRARKTTGQEELADAAGTVVRWQGGRGEVRITGEVWQARAEGPFIFTPGDAVRVAAIDGLVLVVVPAAAPAPTPLVQE